MMQEQGFTGGILSNIPYTKDNPFIVELSRTAIVQFMVSALVMTLAGIAISYAFGKFTKG